MVNCIHPYHLFDTGLKTENGKRRFVFDVTGSKSLSVSACHNAGVFVSEPLTDYIEVPCGKCVACRQAHARAWSFRCLAELQATSKPSWFLTITYDEAHNPLVLSKRDLQLFNKRLRKAFGPFRFFACGEYGERKSRPHYHGIYFGLDIKDLKKYAGHGERTLFVSDKVSSLWGSGFVVIGSVTPESVAYVSGYVSKKFETPDVFQLMSRKPGIGLGWFRDNYQSRGFASLPSGDGRSIKGSVPRSAFPGSVSDYDLSDVDFTGLGLVDSKKLLEWQWSQDYLLRHKKSKRL